VSCDFRQRFLGAVSEGMFFPQSASAFPAEGKTGGGGGSAARVRWQHRPMPVRMLHISKSAATLQPDLDSVNDAVPASLNSERLVSNRHHCGGGNRLITLLDFYLVLP
jgi:hypothetical protein